MSIIRNKIATILEKGKVKWAERSRSIPGCVCARFWQFRFFLSRLKHGTVTFHESQLNEQRTTIKQMSQTDYGTVNTSVSILITELHATTSTIGHTYTWFRTQYCRNRRTCDIRRARLLKLIPKLRNTHNAMKYENTRPIWLEVMEYYALRRRTGPVC